MSGHSRPRTALGIAGVVAVIVTAVVLVWAQRQDDSGSAPQDVIPPAAVAPLATATATDAAATVDGEELTWTSAHGVALPVSTVHGPREMHDGRASGFSRTEVGAAIAAAHLVAMTSPSVGPAVFEPTLAVQVVGANASVMAERVAEQYQALRLSAGVQAGRSVPGADADLVGFALDAFDRETGHATVRLVLTSAELRSGDRVLELSVVLTWSAGDWRLVAPPNGVWDSVARVAISLPVGLVRYDQVA